jgi:hypothetical protein
MKTTNQDHNILLQKFVGLLGESRTPFIETGRKFDKVYVEGKVRYFVARKDMGEVKSGDILGAKSKLAPNFRWFFGNLSTIEKWDWSDFHGKPTNDDTVIAVKGYSRYTHYKRLPVTNGK